MRKTAYALSSLLFVVFVLLNLSFTKLSDNEQAKAKTLVYFEGELAKLFQLANELQQLAEQKASPAELQEKFKTLRIHYKHCEFFIEFFNPNSAEQLNGALLNTVAFDDPNQVTIPPQGLQVVEELIYEDSLNYKFIKEELGNVKGILLRVKQLHTANEYNTEDVYAAAQLELIRIMALGLAGFDATISKQHLAESAASLQALQQLMGFYSDDAALKALFAKNINYLNANSDYLAFDYSNYIAQYWQPLYAKVVAGKKVLGIKSLGNLPLNLNAESIFNKNAWLGSYYAKNKQFSSDKNVVDLGKLLFYDPVLSGNNKRSCASCHKPDKFFTDGLAKSVAFDFDGDVGRNAPTIVNSTLQAALFWDNRVNNTEDQLAEVLTNKREMHGDFDIAVKTLNNSKEYQLLFKKAFGTAATGISKEQLLAAIQAFEHSLTSLASPFDKFMEGELKSLTTQQQQGFNLFMGKAQCATCHFVPHFNGSVPPLYTELEWEIIGTPSTKDNTTLDKDAGAYRVFNKDLHRFAFKTPSLRNVALTAPYMHNGVYDKLDEVVDFYNNGGGLGHGYDVPNQTLPADSLKLSDTEQKSIIAFMQSLTATKGIDISTPKKLPTLLDAKLDKRKIGGEY